MEENRGQESEPPSAERGGAEDPVKPLFSTQVSGIFEAVNNEELCGAGGGEPKQSAGLPPKSPMASKAKHPRGILRKSFDGPVPPLNLVGSAAQSSSSIAGENPNRASAIVNDLSRLMSMKSPGGGLRRQLTERRNSRGFGDTRTPRERALSIARMRSWSDRTTMVELGAAGAAAAPPNAANLPMPMERTGLFPPEDFPTVTAADAHRLLNALEQRLLQAEKVVGRLDTRPPKSPHTDSREGEEGHGDQSDAEESFEAQAKAEWVKDVKGPLAGTNCLTLKLRHLNKLATAVISGRLADFDSKCNSLKTWLEADNSTVSQILLTTHAKKLYLLEHEQFLLTAASQLKSFDELKHYVSPPSLEGLSTYHTRLTTLENNGYKLGLEVNELHDSLQTLALSYTSGMALVSERLRELSEVVASEKAKRAAPRQRRASMRNTHRVIFAPQ